MRRTPLTPGYVLCKELKIGDFQEKCDVAVRNWLKTVGLRKWLGLVFSVSCARFWRGVDAIENKRFGGAILHREVWFERRWIGEIGGGSSSDGVRLQITRKHITNDRVVSILFMSYSNRFPQDFETGLSESDVRRAVVASGGACVAPTGLETIGKNWLGEFITQGLRPGLSSFAPTGLALYCAFPRAAW